MPSGRWLADGTTISPPAANLRDGDRKAFSGRHMVYFREQGETVEVVRVLHQRMGAGRRV